MAQELAPVSDGLVDARAIISVIAKASTDPSVDIHKMERLVAMHHEMEDRHQSRAFAAAMNAVQQKLPTVVKSADNPHTRSRYAKLETIIEAINPIVTGNGFAVSFGTADGAPAGHYRVTCVLSHAAGHERNYQADVPTDISGSQGKSNKTPIQGFGSAMTYARRYLMTMIFNVAIGEDDDDGNSGKPHRTREDISREAEWKKQQAAEVERDVAQIETLQALERYKAELLTPEYMGRLGTVQFRVDELIAVRQRELEQLSEYGAFWEEGKPAGISNIGEQPEWDRAVAHSWLGEASTEAELSGRASHYGYRMAVAALPESIQAKLREEYVERRDGFRGKKPAEKEAPKDAAGEPVKHDAATGEVLDTDVV